jgi:type II secretory pathway component PulK
VRLHPERKAGGEEGVVMLLVLVIIVLSITSVGAFARSAVLEVMGMRSRADRGRAELLARSGVEVAVRVLKDDLEFAGQIPGGDLETSADPWYLIGERALVLPDHGQLRVRVRDMGARVNLNGLVDERRIAHSKSRDFLVAALKHMIAKMPGRPEDRFYKPVQLAEAILDWLDLDVRTRLGDLELYVYVARGARAVPANRAFFSFNELADLPGVDAFLLESMRHYFTVQPIFANLGESGLNPNTAPGWALGMIYMGTSERRDLIEYREVLATLQRRVEGRIFCPVSEEDPCTNFQELINQVGETAFPPLTYHNRTFEIESVGEYREASACITAVVERHGPADVRAIAYGQRCR